MSAALVKANAAARRGEPFGLHTAEMDRVLHWSNQEPLPKSREWGVRRHKCRRCGTRMQWIDCPTGGWWAHDVHPSDDHDAVRRRAA